MSSLDEGIAVPQDRLSRFVAAALMARGSVPEQANAVAKALVSTSLRGVDSHGIRLLPHYLRALGGGRINKAPTLSARCTAPGAAIVDADDGFGHHAGYRAIAEGIALASDAGIAGISVMESLRPLMLMIGAMFAVLMLITFVPDIVLFLPNLME